VRRLIQDLVKSVACYALVITGGQVCFLSVAPVLGYLPYSDRPGAG
jgi:hypothetical protein